MNCGRIGKTQSVREMHWREVGEAAVSPAGEPSALGPVCLPPSCRPQARAGRDGGAWSRERIGKLHGKGGNAEGPTPLLCIAAHLPLSSPEKIFFFRILPVCLLKSAISIQFGTLWDESQELKRLTGLSAGFPVAVALSDDNTL